MQTPFDFYSLLARHWGCSRMDAKHYILLVAHTIGYPVFTYSVVNEWHLEPKVLAFIPTDARAEVLAQHNIIVGEN